MDFIAKAFKGSSDEFSGTHHASVTHELLGGAVAFEAAKAWEKHVAENGKPDDHAMAKELLAGFAGAALTGLIESKGLNTWDEYKRKAALKHATDKLSETVTYK